jgi:hypothetical protein
MAPWNPVPATLAVVQLVQTILVEYAEYLPLTIRQIFYRLVGIHDFPKTERDYKRLGEYLNRARRARMISFDAIRDDGITLAEPNFWAGLPDMIDAFVATARGFTLNRQDGQPRWRIFAVEAAGMVPQVQRIADPFGIPVHSGGGFDSTTAKHDLAVKLGKLPRVEVLHIGDHDPSGVHMFSSAMEDVQAFARDLGYPSDIRFTRLAVTPAQVRRLKLPQVEPKKGDTRSFEGLTTQAEAIAPDELARIISAAIHDRLDVSAYEAVLEQEEACRRRLSDRRIRGLLSTRRRRLEADERQYPLL